VQEQVHEGRLAYRRPKGPPSIPAASLPAREAVVIEERGTGFGLRSMSTVNGQWPTSMACGNAGWGRRASAKRNFFSEGIGSYCVPGAGELPGIKLIAIPFYGHAPLDEVIYSVIPYWYSTIVQFCARVLYNDAVVRIHQLHQSCMRCAAERASRLCSSTTLPLLPLTNCQSLVSGVSGCAGVHCITASASLLQHLLYSSTGLLYDPIFRPEAERETQTASHSANGNA
jgi:hypothetical protein